jgi:cell shape-determining protein MreC
MSYLRFKHLYFGLMGLSAFGAFVLPQKYARRAQPEVQTLFAPVAWPVRSVAEKLSSRLAPEVAEQARSRQAVIDENDELRHSLDKMAHDLEELRKMSAGFESFRELRDRCQFFNVLFGDSGNRDSLALRSSKALDGLRTGMFALHPAGVAGVVERSGVGGAQVRLITDSEFGVKGYFRKFERTDEGDLYPYRLKTGTVLVQGAGGGEMRVLMQPLKLLRDTGVEPGTEVVVDDPEWPPELQGMGLGRVTEIRPRRDSALHADVIVKPPTDLRRLTRVMVMVRE